jgi:sigma-B regulation protein RsbU (phosphoserine phosphatase)
LDYKQNFVKFIRAGHTPPVIIPADPNQSIREIESDGLGIGLTRTVATFKKSLEERTIKMKSGDVIVFYTDGVVEAARESEPAGKTMKTFGEEKFREILGSLKGQPAVKVLDRMRHELAVFYGDTSPVDDYTLFILGRTQQE